MSPIIDNAIILGLHFVFLCDILIVSKVGSVCLGRKAALHSQGCAIENEHTTYFNRLCSQAGQFHTSATG